MVEMMTLQAHHPPPPLQTQATAMTQTAPVQVPLVPAPAHPVEVQVPPALLPHPPALITALPGVKRAKRGGARSTSPATSPQHVQ